VSLPATRLAPAQARIQVRAVIDAWNIPVNRYTAALLVSELVTNAVRHDAGKEITLSIRTRHGRLRVEVHDSASGMPDPTAETDEEAEDGRGLLLVDSLADEWGFYQTPDGKAVYFALLFED
jgi:anti-sigma regulatory factor (Ser/Thr protein kinase)